MPSSGLEYAKSKEGIIRAIIIVVGCITFALVASRGNWGRGSAVSWVLAAYIISWCFSLLSYFFIVTTLASKMECGVSYDAVDVCLSVFSFFNCFLASIILAMYANEYIEEWIAGDVFGFILTILYAVEVYFLMGNAPGNLNFLLTPHGIVKAAIFILGCTTFALLDASGYRCYYEDGCDSARTWAFAAFIYCWVVALILLIIRLTGFHTKISVFETVDFIWSIFSFVNYLIASIVLACYLECSNFEFRACSLRLASVIFGFITTILFAVDVFLLKKSSGGVTPSGSKSSSDSNGPSKSKKQKHNNQEKDIPIA